MPTTDSAWFQDGRFTTQSFDLSPSRGPPTCKSFDLALIRRLRHTLSHHSFDQTGRVQRSLRSLTQQPLRSLRQGDLERRPYNRHHSHGRSKTILLDIAHSFGHNSTHAAGEVALFRPGLTHAISQDPTLSIVHGLTTTIPMATQLSFTLSRRKNTHMHINPHLTNNHRIYL